MKEGPMITEAVCLLYTWDVGDPSDRHLPIQKEEPQFQAKSAMNIVRGDARVLRNVLVPTAISLLSPNVQVF